MGSCFKSADLGETLHYFEYTMLQRDQQRHQKEHPGSPFFPCPCCRDPETVPEFTRDAALKKEIEDWLNRIVKHLEQLGSQEHVPVSAAATRLAIRLNDVPFTSKDLECRRRNLIRDIQNFLLYGNNYDFLQEQFAIRLESRVMTLGTHLSRGDVVKASAVSLDVSRDACGESSRRCLMM